MIKSNGLRLLCSLVIPDSMHTSLRNWIITKVNFAYLLSRMVSHILLLRYSLFSGKILSVRAICTDNGRQIYLVRHSYTPGWHLPGGAVDNGMSAEEALQQELEEEGNLLAVTRPVLRHVYLQAGASQREHIMLYTVSVRQDRVFEGNLEIVEGRFFSLDEIPSDVDPSAARRICEWVVGEFKDREW